MITLPPSAFFLRLKVKDSEIVGYFDTDNFHMLPCSSRDLF